MTRILQRRSICIVRTGAHKAVPMVLPIDTDVAKDYARQAQTCNTSRYTDTVNKGVGVGETSPQQRALVRKRSRLRLPVLETAYTSHVANATGNEEVS